MGAVGSGRANLVTVVAATERRADGMGRWDGRGPGCIAVAAECMGVRVRPWCNRDCQLLDFPNRPIQVLA